MKLSKINFNEVQIPSRIQPIDVVSCDVKTFKELREGILGSWKRRYLRHHSEGTVVTILDYDKVYEEEHHGFTLTLILCEVMVNYPGLTLPVSVFSLDTQQHTTSSKRTILKCWIYWGMETIWNDGMLSKVEPLLLTKFDV